MVAKATDKTEVLHPGAGMEQRGLDAARMGALARSMVLEGQRKVKARLEGSRCMWERRQLQLCTGKQAQKEQSSVATAPRGHGQS